MKSSAALSLLFLLRGIHAAVLPQLVGSELESTSVPMKRDISGNELLPEAARSMTDDPSLDPSLNLKRDLSARDPQGPASNPGEFIDVGLSRSNPANRHRYYEKNYEKDGDERPERKLMMEDGFKTEYHRHHNGSHHEHQKEGILTEFNSHGEHIVVYNGTHFANGTAYHPANETMGGGKMLEKVVVDGDEVVVYRQPMNETYHHHHHHNHTWGPSPTATGVWLPSGTGWIPSGTGWPRHHRKVPNAAYAGFDGPMSKRDGSASKDVK